MLPIEVREKILEMLPVKQNEIWRTLSVGRQMVSDVVRELEAEKLIRRTPHNSNKVNTYILEKFVWNKAELKPAILSLLPIFQEDIWKRLGLEHRRISKLVRELEAEGLLVREVRKHTFWLVPTTVWIPEPVAPTTIITEPKPIVKRVSAPKKPKERIKPKEHKFTSLLSGNMFSPCTGCMDECEATTCKKLGDWVCA